MDIWFVSHYSMPPEFEQRVKTLKFSEYLKKNGYNTTIFSASTIHNTDINLIKDNVEYITKSYNGLDFVHVKTSKYSGSGFKRIINMQQFHKRFYKVAKKFKPPFAIVADINCTNYKGILKYCKENNVKLISDIRDLWPLSIVEYLGISKKNLIIKHLYRQEKKLYESSDDVIFSMEGGKQYIIDKGWTDNILLDKVHYINNGIDIEDFNKNKSECVVSDSDLISEKFKIIYTGSIRKVNNVGLILDVAKQCPDALFLIYGKGDEKDQLEKRIVNENITNVKLKGFVEKKYIPFVLSCSDLNYINVEPTELTSKYGTSLNKLFDYCASGKPIISNLNTNYNLIEKYNCGITAKNGTCEEMIMAIKEIQSMSIEKYIELCENAKKLAADFDYEKLSAKLESIIFKK